jgi:hypothetical protein
MAVYITSLYVFLVYITVVLNKPALNISLHNSNPDSGQPVYIILKSFSSISLHNPYLMPIDQFT